MKITKKELIEQYTLLAMKCDRCGEEFTDPYEIQEFHKIDFVGGYNSVFGDMTHIEADICQHCLKEMISWFCREDDNVWIMS